MSNKIYSKERIESFLAQGIIPSQTQASCHAGNFKQSQKPDIRPAAKESSPSKP